MAADHKWFKGLKTKAEKDARRKELKSFKTAFEALWEVLEGFEEAAPDYNNPSWSHKQADVNGANRKLRQVQKMMDVD